MFDLLRQDIEAIKSRDPAARSTWEIILCYPGLHALWFYRISHWFWLRRRHLLGRWLSQLGRFITGIEIHPGAKIGRGLVIDHGMATVIGETAEIGHNVTLYHNVTLGGVSLKKEKRHPTVEDNVVVGAGAQILGPITIGAGSRIGANAVVVKDVPADSVVTGVPGRVRSHAGLPLFEPSEVDLQHNIMPDVTVELLQALTARVTELEEEVARLRAAEGLPVAGRGH
ncbi:MAG: serine O-acetyltransferase [Caldilineaceae bacterium]|nr:serine O-acetyltransferase [Caldilineaceae bacterium]